MMDQNTCFAYLNMELPDDIRRLKEAGYYDAAIAPSMPVWPRTGLPARTSPCTRRARCR